MSKRIIEMNVIEFRIRIIHKRIFESMQSKYANRLWYGQRIKSVLPLDYSECQLIGRISATLLFAITRLYISLASFDTSSVTVHEILFYHVYLLVGMYDFNHVFFRWFSWHSKTIPLFLYPPKSFRFPRYQISINEYLPSYQISKSTAIKFEQFKFRKCHGNVGEGNYYQYLTISYIIVNTDLI